MGTATNPIILYDGVCGLCNRFVQFILRRDKSAMFRFAALQSNFAADILRRHGTNPEKLDTVYLVTNYNQPGETIQDRSGAALAILRDLGGVWRGIATIAQILPESMRDWGYDRIAESRYRIFGKFDTCPIPDEKTRSRFLDL